MTDETVETPDEMPLQIKIAEEVKGKLEPLVRDTYRDLIEARGWLDLFAVTVMRSQPTLSGLTRDRLGAEVLRCFAQLLDGIPPAMDVVMESNQRALEAGEEIPPQGMEMGITRENLQERNQEAADGLLQDCRMALVELEENVLPLLMDTLDCNDDVMNKLGAVRDLMEIFEELNKSHYKLLRKLDDAVDRYHLLKRLEEAGMPMQDAMSVQVNLDDPEGSAENFIEALKQMIARDAAKH